VAEARLSGIAACVFDAYGTLFDVHSPARRCRDQLGDKADTLSELWRRKQLEYTWLRSLMGRHEDFWQVTSDALDFAMEAHRLADPALRAQLMQLYLDLDAYPEAGDTLRALRDGGIRTAILSNGSPTMLTSAVKSANLVGLFDAVVSVESAKIFKPHPSVYQLATDALHLAASEIAFVTANGWDAAGAAVFGYRAVWVNRTGQPREMLPGEPAAVVRGIDAVPALLGL
jgi:2-haloacid dehalogenase